MTPKEIGERLVQIGIELVDKIGEQPFIEPEIEVDGRGMCTIRLYKAYSSDSEYSLGRVSDDTFCGVLDKASSLISHLPSKEDADKADFIKQLGGLIDRGNEIGLDVDFMSPLTESMKALSENILEDKS